MEIKILNTIDKNSVVYVKVSIDGVVKDVILLFRTEENEIRSRKLEKILKNKLGIEILNFIPDYEIDLDFNGCIDLLGTPVNESPVITGDEECLIEKLKEKEIEYRIEGNSGFAARNRVVITDPRYQGDKNLIKSWVLTSDVDPYSELGKLFIRDNDQYPYVGYSLKKVEKEMLDYTKLQNLTKNIKEKCEKEYERAVVAKYGDILNGVEFGPYEEFNRLPKGYIVIYAVRTKCTADYRQNRSHTYRVWAVRKGTKGIVELNGIPDKEKGKIIGKGGRRIKEACKLIGCKKIILK